MRKILFSAALVAILIPIAVAQDSLDLEPIIHVPEQGSVLRNSPHQNRTPPKYCKPCLFYAGDWDSNATDANGLSNEVDLIVSTGAAVYTPFTIPKGKTWTVTGLFTNNFMLTMGLDPRTIPYEIRKGIPKAGGNGGKLVCHGKKPASLTQLPQNWYGPSIYATKVERIQGCRLHSGKYWMSVVPYCTNVNDGTCTNGYRDYLSNDDGAMNNRYGPIEPANNSFFNSVYFGANWEPSSEEQTSSRFSVGVEGTEK